ncbi:hypothetical protein ES703_97525 [subsurface metagenome]
MAITTDAVEIIQHSTLVSSCGRSHNDCVMIHYTRLNLPGHRVGLWSYSIYEVFEVVDLCESGVIEPVHIAVRLKISTFTIIKKPAILFKPVRQKYPEVLQINITVGVKISGYGNIRFIMVTHISQAFVRRIRGTCGVFM